MKVVNPMLAMVEDMFASPAVVELPDADARYNYKKKGGDADAPKTKDVFD